MRYIVDFFISVVDTFNEFLEFASTPLVDLLDSYPILDGVLEIISLPGATLLTTMIDTALIVYVCFAFAKFLL